ncbi:hypothetical protein J4403_00110 [Candidatus Woesearchaeota archaeon]|nr:hypothetical protein [Candidatus Woesearchaeota archaeon]
MPIETVIEAEKRIAQLEALYHNYYQDKDFSPEDIKRVGFNIDPNAIHTQSLITLHKMALEQYLPTFYPNGFPYVSFRGNMTPNQVNELIRLKEPAFNTLLFQFYKGIDGEITALGSGICDVGLSLYGSKEDLDDALDNRAILSHFIKEFNLPEIQTGSTKEIKLKGKGEDLKPALHKYFILKHTTYKGGISINLLLDQEHGLNKINNLYFENFPTNEFYELVKKNPSWEHERSDISFNFKNKTYSGKEIVLSEGKT